MNANLHSHKAVIRTLLEHVNSIGKADRVAMMRFLRSTTPMSTKNCNNLINDLIADGAFDIAR